MASREVALVGLGEVGPEGDQTATRKALVTPVSFPQVSAALASFPLRALAQEVMASSTLRLFSPPQLFSLFP